MTRVKQKSDGKGSLNDIQILINEKVELINNTIKSNLNEFEINEIIWISPQKEDNYAEYRDDCFLRKVGLDPDEIQLDKFWPRKGPQWDALAKTDDGKILLVEAKANISELRSSSKAGEKSKSLIQKSLDETKDSLGVNNDVDWLKQYYQYTNRLSHLYFLREKCKKQVFLINVYFIGDCSVKGPKTKQKWIDALEKLKIKLGLESKHKLSKYIADIFINVQELKGANR